MENVGATIQEQQSAGGQASLGESPSASELLAQVRRLSESPAGAREQAIEFLAIVQRGLGGLAGAITLSLEREEFDHASTGGPEGIEGWREAIRSAAFDARSHSRSIGRVFGSDGNAPEFVLLAAPIESDGGEATGGVAVLCPWRGERDAERLRLHLRAALLVGSHTFAARARPVATVRVDDFARALARVGQYRSMQEFGFALTNAIKQRFNCDQTSLGLLKNGALRVMCISGLDGVNERSPGVHHIQQSMCECLDAGEQIIEQDRDQWADAAEQRGGLLHARWRSAAGGAAIASLPLMSGNEAVGVISLVRQGSDPFRPEEIASLQKLLAPMAATIPVVQKSTRTLAAHAGASVRDAGRWVMRRESITRKVVIAATVALAFWMTFKPTMYRVAADATVVASTEIVVASTLDSAVSRVLVRSGDFVRAGQPLIELDASAQRVQREHLRTEVEKASLRLKDAIAAGNPAEAAIARAERDIHRAGLDLIESQIEQAVLVAPVSGVVVGSELSALRGRLVPLGEPLLSIAQQGSLKLRIDVPERRVTDLAAGATVRFASHARPEDAQTLNLEHIEPAATTREGRPVFVAHAQFEGAERWLHPGMEGVAMINVGERPNWWVGFHHLIDYANLKFWIE